MSHVLCVCAYVYFHGCVLANEQLYAGGMPKEGGYKMGWGFWVAVVVSLVYMAIFFLILTMKPEGIPHYKRAFVFIIPHHLLCFYLIMPVGVV